VILQSLAGSYPSVQTAIKALIGAGDAVCNGEEEQQAAS